MVDDLTLALVREYLKWQTGTPFLDLVSQNSTPASLSKQFVSGNMDSLLVNPNVRKALDMLSFAEGTTKYGYSTAFGNTPLPNIDTIPNVGKTFTDNNGKTQTTHAVGRYQYQPTTYKPIADSLGISGFTPKEQDIVAIAHLAKLGALPNILAGDFTGAINKMGGEWAGLPSSTAPQNKRSWNEINSFLAKHKPTTPEWAYNTGNNLVSTSTLGDTGPDWANQPTGIEKFLGDNPSLANYNTDSLSLPASQLPEVDNNNQVMIRAAANSALANAKAMDTFDWNPDNKDSTVNQFAAGVVNNTRALDNLYAKNADYMKAFTAPTADSYLGRVADKIGAAFQVSGNTLTERYLKAVQDSQSATGTAMSKQVEDLQKLNKATIIDPNAYNLASDNLIKGQQVDAYTYNIGANNMNSQAQVASQLVAKNDEIQALKEKVAASQNHAANIDDATLINAARSVGINVPDGIKNAELKTLLGTSLPAIQAIATNNNSLGSDPYTAVKTVGMLGNTANPELARQAQIHTNFQNSIINNAITKGIYTPKEIPTGATKEMAAAIEAENEANKRVLINNAYRDAAQGWNANIPGNPYNAGNKDIETLANGLAIPKGIAVNELKSLNPLDLVKKATEAGATSVDIASFYKGLTESASKGTNFKTFNAPEPTKSFMVQFKGLPDKIDLTTPAGVEKLKALEKTTPGTAGTWAKILAAPVGVLWHPIYNKDETGFSTLDRWFGTKSVSNNK